MAILGNFLSSTTESIDPNASGWIAKTNCTVALGSGGRSGDGALKLTSLAAGEMQARTVSSYAVTPLNVYQAFADASGATVPERIGIRWLDAANAEISITWSLTTATASSTWHRIAVGGPAPGSAVRAQVVVSCMTPAAAAVIGYFENVYLGYPQTTTGNLLAFNTETADVDGTAWVSDGNSTLARTAPMVQWPVNYYLAGGEVIAMTVTANGNASIRAVDRAPAVTGTEYVAYTYLNPPTSGSTAWVELRFYDGAGTQLAATRSVLAAPGTGWYRQIASAVAPAGTATCSIAAGLDSATAAQVLRIDNAVITVAPALVTGSVLPYADASFEQGVAGWTVASGVATLARSTPWGSISFTGSYCGTVTSSTATTSVIRSARFPIGAAAGQTWRWDLVSQVTTGGFTLTRAIKWYDATNALITTTSDAPAAIPTPNWWNLSYLEVAPAGATQAVIELTVAATSPGSVWRIDRAALYQSVAILETTADDDTASVTVTNRQLDTSQFITVYRVTPDGARTLVRGTGGLVDNVAITSDQLVLEDYEAPLGVVVTYRIELRTSTGASAGSRTSNAVTIALGDGNYVWLKDVGEPQRNVRVMAAAPPTWTRPIEQAVYRPAGRRNAVIHSGTRGGYEGELQIMTKSDLEREALHHLIDSGHVLLWQANPGYGIADTYVSVGAVPEARAGGDATDPWRVWSLPMIQVDMPITVGVAGSAGRTWQDILTENATWGDLLTKYATWEDVLFDRKIGG